MASNEVTASLPKHFGAAGHRKVLYRAQAASFLDSIEHLKTEEESNKPENVALIAEKFYAFLGGCNFKFAIHDFKDLCEQSKKDKREDNTTPWFHQLTPIVAVLALIRDDIISLEYLEEFGGLETVIRTHIYHDAHEDTPLKLEDIAQKTTELLATFHPIDENNPDTKEEFKQQQKRAAILVKNIELISKKRVKCDEITGEPITRKDGGYEKEELFENTRDYIHNLHLSPDSNPALYLLKQADTTINLAQMLLAKKFIAKKRLEYCNSREDMFGRRQGATTRASKKWPKFANAIGKFDSIMGAVLYLNIGVLEYVDLAYRRNPEKYSPGQRIYPLDIDEYLSNAMKLDIPRAFSPIHIMMDRMRTVARTHPKRAIRKRMRAYLKRAVYPALEPYKEYFPEISELQEQPQQTPPLPTAPDSALTAEHE